VDTKGWYNVETDVFTMERLPRGRYTKEFREEAVKLAEVGKGYRPLSEVEVELGNLRRELARVKMERDILRKAAAYFAKESQEGTR
jgi:hypothetical protein